MRAFLRIYAFTVVIKTCLPSADRHIARTPTRWCPFRRIPVSIAVFLASRNPWFSDSAMNDQQTQTHRQCYRHAFKYRTDLISKHNHFTGRRIVLRLHFWKLKPDRRPFNEAFFHVSVWRVTNRCCWSDPRHYNIWRRSIRAAFSGFFRLVTIGERCQLRSVGPTVCFLFYAFYPISFSLLFFFLYFFFFLFCSFMVFKTVCVVRRVRFQF